jgi:hypothetical protein
MNAPLAKHPVLRLTAAVSSGNLLSVVTLSFGSRFLYLVPSMTQFFELASDDQAGIRCLANQMWRFFEQTGIGYTLVRRGPSTGPQKVSPFSFKIETILQLLPIECDLVHSQQVSNWSRKADWLFPLAQQVGNKRQRTVQEMSIKTAAFGIAQVLAGNVQERPI